MKRIIKDYFTFSRKERIAVMILLLLIAFFIAAPYFYPVTLKPPVLNKALADFLTQSQPVKADSSPEKTELFHETVPGNNIRPHESFAFDPNTVSAEDWKRLGLTDKTIRTILNYRSKGGKFRTAEDIRKIWGIKKEDADRLVLFANIAQKEKDKPAVDPKDNTGNRKPATQNKIQEIDINTATAEEWESLPGIGEVLAGRIIKYRERLNGFLTTDQVKKTYGISDSVFQSILPYLKINPATIPKLDLNKVSAYDLRTRISLPDATAKAIVFYRLKNGAYQSVSDLKKIVSISDSLYTRIAPYLKIE